MNLRELIVDIIRHEGPVPFSRYMELCLYHPELGYYARHNEKFGKGGDFYTSSDVHAVFGRLLCRQFEEMWRMLGSPGTLDLVELGPGRGLFAQDVIDWAGKKFAGFAAALRYHLVEGSPALRRRLQERFAGNPRVRVDDSLEHVDPGDALIVFGNEFFDALPVEIISGAGQLYLSESDGQFIEHWHLPSADVGKFVKRYSDPPRKGGRVEAAIEAQEWMDRIAKLFETRRGFAIFIDYGYTREQQAAGRHLDTLITYRAHRASANPYEAPGEQDITAHVNFTALQSAAEEHGMSALGLITQSQLLLGLGQQNEFADAFEDCARPEERVKVSLQLRQLLSPEAMGERFHALWLSKGIEKEEAARLSGLSFGR